MYTNDQLRQRFFSGKTLFSSPPLVINPELAAEIGLNEAIVLQQLHYWIQIQARGKDEYRCVHDGSIWESKTLAEWNREFPFFSEPTLKRTFAKLCKADLVWRKQLSDNTWDRRNFYTINYQKLQRILAANASDQIDPIDQVKLTRSTSDQTDPIDEATLTPSYKIENQETQENRHPDDDEAFLSKFGISADTAKVLLQEYQSEFIREKVSVALSHKPRNPKMYILTCLYNVTTAEYQEWLTNQAELENARKLAAKRKAERKQAEVDDEAERERFIDESDKLKQSATDADIKDFELHIENRSLLRRKYAEGGLDNIIVDAAFREFLMERAK